LEVIEVLLTRLCNDDSFSVRLENNLVVKESLGMEQFKTEFLDAITHKLAGGVQLAPGNHLTESVSGEGLAKRVDLI
jgi:hypothetical protein